MSVVRIGAVGAKIKAPQRLVGGDFERFHRELIGACTSKLPSIEVDLSALETFDYSGLQLLVCAVHTVSNRGGVLNMSCGSAELMEQLARYGFTELYTNGQRDAA